MAFFDVFQHVCESVCILSWISEQTHCITEAHDFFWISHWSNTDDVVVVSCEPMITITIKHKHRRRRRAHKHICTIGDVESGLVFCGRWSYRKTTSNLTRASKKKWKNSLGNEYNIYMYKTTYSLHALIKLITYQAYPTFGSWANNVIRPVLIRYLLKKKLH